MRHSDPRRSVRRCVSLECDVHSAYWEGAVPFLASDLSVHGIWLDSPFTLEVGQEVLLSFVPPGSSNTPVLVTATIARVGAPDGQPSGMGLAFTSMRDSDRTLLARCLEGRPPRLPARRVPAAPLPKPRRDPLLSRVRPSPAPRSPAPC
jgi:hypothetical protein